MPTARVCLFVLLVCGATATPASAQLTADQAIGIIRTVYDQEGFDITGRSTREQLNAFLMRAVGIVHFGHPAYNASPDPRWCVKNGGPGRPMADDVLARCDTREAWDLVGGIGGPNPIWAPTYIGTLPSIQNIYAPTPPEPYSGRRMALSGTMARPQLSLAWTPAAVGTSSVSYTVDVRGPFTLRVPVGKQTGVSGPVADGVYTFVVEATFSTGILVRSNSTVVPVGNFALPGPPMGLTAATTGQVVAFAWQPPLNDGGAPVQAFVLEAGTAPGRSDVAVLPLGGVLSFVTPPIPDGGYWVRVRARTVAGVGPPSAEAHAVVGALPPAAPVLSGLASAGGQVSLTWTVPGGTPPVTGYRLLAGSAPGMQDVAVLDLPPNATTFASAGVPRGTYYVRIVAASGIGFSDLSNELTVVVP
jgi:hypothetical protein